MHALDDWCRSLLSETEQGPLVLANVKFDCVHHRPTRELIRRFLCSLTQVPAERRCATPGKLIAELARGEYLVRGEPARAAGGYSRIMDASDFFYYNVTDEAKQRIGLAIRPTASAADVAWIAGHLVGNVEGRMSNGRGFAWVTPSAAVERVRNAEAENGRTEEAAGGQPTAPPTVATRLRNKLGLDYVGVNTRLIEIRYPDDVARNLPLAAPTFLEGGDGMVYRSNPQADNWGRTVDLETWADGLPEAVHVGVELTERFAVGHVGLVDSDVGPIDYERLVPPSARWADGDSLAGFAE